MAKDDKLSDEPRQLELPDAELTILVDEAETNGKFSLIEATVEPGADTALHWHQETMEAFYVLEGALTVTMDGEERILRRGESLFVPPHIVHAPANREDDVCRHLLLLSPGEFEGFFRERARARVALNTSEQDIFERYDLHEPPNNE